ncbi:MAG TPA: CPBP family intramembrane glutamic endopeptidase [Rhodanobacteraceae bacterium]|nr:CPBP family intramembrane glutamic endopeptidase [Rhodanobacteraceae bacterium]
MNSTTVAPKASGRTTAVLWCVAVGIGAPIVARAIRILVENVTGAGPAGPASIPAEWWTIDVRATSFAIRELGLLALFALFLRARGLRWLDLGFRRPGTALAWGVAFVVLALGLASHPFGRAGAYPVAPYTLYAGAAIGIPVALFEESIYRGFVITTLRAGGFGVVGQVALAGVLFGCAHMFYLGSDWTVPLFTGVLGCIWAWIYVAGRDALWPTLITHAINDAVIMPYFYLHGVY